jgi:hypothetical protein
MKRLARALAGIFGIGVLGSVVLFIPQKNAVGAGGAPVTVLNTPLPVSGSVNASQSGTWNVGITGTPSVNVGTPTVNVASLPQVSITPPALTKVANIDDPGRVSYQSTVSNVGKCSGTACSFSFPSVPAGHRVVVQHIGGIVDFNTVPTNIEVLIIGSPQVFMTAFFAPPVPSGSLSSSFDQPVLFYIDENQFVSVNVFINNGASFNGAQFVDQFVTLTGYELDCSVAPCAAIAQ